MPWDNQNRPGGLDKRRLPWQQSLQGKLYERVVFSDAELRIAIGDIISKFDANAPLGSLGSKIVFGSSFAIEGPIRIPEQCAGITFTAVSRFPVYAKGIFENLFEVQAELVTIENMFVYTTPDNYFNNFVAVLDSVTAGRSADDLVVKDNTISAQTLFKDFSTTNASRSVIVNNIQLNVSAGDSIDLNSRNCKIMGNNLGSTINLRGDATECVIIGNDVRNGAIFTDTSGGFNVVVGNMRATVVPHGSDQVGLNVL
jgi:hypothetical protein